MDMTTGATLQSLQEAVLQRKPKITARDCNVYYGEKHALKHVDVDIPERSVTAFIGPSGCGKSTFLRCLNRMNDTITSCRVTGKIMIDGEDIYDPALDPVLLRARVGMVFQKPNPFPKSIYDNVAYGPRIHGLGRTKADLDEAVALVKAVRPHVRKFHSSEYVNGFASGDYCLGLGFSGDSHIAGLRAAEAGQKFKISYSLPPEGALMYFDVFAIPADAPNTEAAHSFIDFMLLPDVAATAANETGFSTTNGAAAKLIEAGVKDNPNLYPTGSMIDKLTVPRTLDQKELRQWTTAWQAVKGER